jgi:hypothetical protein
LGVGTNAPTSPFTLIGSSQFGNAVGSGSIETFDGFYSMSFGKSTSIYNPNNNHTRIFMQSSQTFVDNTSGNFQFRSAGTTVMNLQSGNFAVGNGSDSILARTHIKGSGSTSATTSLLVQNSAGSTAMEVKDNLTIGMGGAHVSGSSGFGISVASITASYPCFLMNSTGGGGSKIGFNMDTAKLYFSEETNGSSLFVKNDSSAGATAALNASACLQADSTTRGFLPPRMTTTQINAIASPANGLEVYNTTLACPCFYDGTAWRKVSHTTM